MDAVGLVHFCGTNTTFFLPALRDCLGFVTGLLSEDTPTGEKLNLLGWDSCFVDQALAVGTVKETASDTMLQRFRWMGGNGLLFLHQHGVGSPGFMRHANSGNRAHRITAAQRGVPPGELQTPTGSGEAGRDAAFAATVPLGLPSSEPATGGPVGDAPPRGSNGSSLDGNGYPSNGRRGDGGRSSSGVPALAAVGRCDRGQTARWRKAKHPVRRLVLWSVYDVGMGYMYTSTVWHLAFHALLLDSLLLSDGERPVTMQPLFGVLYSVGSFGVLLAIGPASQVSTHVSFSRPPPLLLLLLLLLLHLY